MQRNDTHLVIRETPAFLWGLGILFMGVGAMIIFQGGSSVVIKGIFAFWQHHALL